MGEKAPLAAYRIYSVPDSIYYVPNFLSTEECDALLAKIPANRWTALSHRRLQSHPSQLTASQTLVPGPLPAWLATSPAPILQRLAALGVFAGMGPGAPDGDGTGDDATKTKEEPNHVLVNEYLPGQGIMPHEDGGAYWPVVATVSLGGTAVLNLYDKSNSSGIHETRGIATSSSGNRGAAEAKPVPAESTSARRPTHRILQEPGSLLVTCDAAYSSMLHGIAEVTADTQLDASSVANWGLLRSDTRRELLAAGGTKMRATRVSLTYRIVKRVSKINMAMLGVGGRRVAR